MTKPQRTRAAGEAVAGMLHETFCQFCSRPTVKDYTCEVCRPLVVAIRREERSRTADKVRLYGVIGMSTIEQLRDAILDDSDLGD